MILQPAKLKPYLLLLVILLVAFLPVSTLHFGMKNDAFSDNFPNKFFFSEAIHSGFLPLWNPYLNFGFPIYADPGFAFWNPITWFFGAVVDYTAYTLTIEVSLYIYIAGLTMYHLSRYFNFSSYIAVAVAAMYMCSGFFVGELQHINFLTGAAFLPLLLQRFLVLFNKPTFKNSFLLSLAIYMVVACGHPAIPIAAIYFFITLIVSLFILNDASRKNWKTWLKYQLISICIFIVLYSPAIYSYISIIPSYGRGSSLDQFSETLYGFSPTSYLSFLYPFSTVKAALFLTDDLSMRNGFFSLGGFILVLLQLKNKNFLVRSLFIAALVMLVLSSGGYVKAQLFSHLPLLSYIRTNGEFRVFSILCFCVIAGFGLHHFETNFKNAGIGFRKVLMVLLFASLSIIIISAIKTFDVQNLLSVAGPKTMVTTIKTVINNLSFYNVLLISATLQFVIVLALLFVKADTKKIAAIIIADLMLNSIMYLPFTGVGTVTLAKIQEEYNKGEKGIIVPPLIAIKNIDTFFTDKTGLIGSASFYNKKIGITKLTDYPSYFSSTQYYFESNLAATINNLPYVFLKNEMASYANNLNYVSSAVGVNYFSPQQVRITVNVQEEDSLVFLQNSYKNWRAESDGKEIMIKRAFVTFMSVPVKKGRHTVQFYYKDDHLFYFVLLSAITPMIVVIVLASRKKRV